MSIKYILEAVDKITPTLKLIKASFISFKKSLSRKVQLKCVDKITPTLKKIKKYFDKIKTKNIEIKGADKISPAFDKITLALYKMQKSFDYFIRNLNRTHYYANRNLNREHYYANKAHYYANRNLNRELYYANKAHYYANRNLNRNINKGNYFNSNLDRNLNSRYEVGLNPRTYDNFFKDPNLKSLTYRMRRSVGGIGNEIRNAGLEFAPMSIGLAAFGKSALQQSANFESLAIQLEILTGSAKRGKELFNNLSNFAIETPFKMNEVVTSTRTLLGFGIPYEKSIDTIKMLGDVTAGSGADLERLAIVFGQVAGLTKLHGQDALQFVSNSIPIWDLLSKSTGKSIKQLRKLSEQGKISFGMVQDAIRKATEENGMYYKATDKLSESLSGKFAKLQDKIDIALSKIGDDVVKNTNLKKGLDDVSKIIDKLTEKFINLSPETKEFIFYLVLFSIIMGPLLLGLGQLIITFNIVAGSLAFLIARLKLLSLPVLIVIGIFLLLYNTWDDFRIVVNFLVDKLKELWQWLTKIASIGIGKIANLFGIDNKMQIETTSNINTSNINNNKLQAGGNLDIFFNNMPQGTKANFTPIAKNFMNVGLNTIYGGS
jgi:tape measure domain-containing protein